MFVIIFFLVPEPQEPEPEPEPTVPAPPPAPMLAPMPVYNTALGKVLLEGELLHGEYALPKKTIATLNVNDPVTLPVNRSTSDNNVMMQYRSAQKPISANKLDGTQSLIRLPADVEQEKSTLRPKTSVALVAALYPRPETSQKVDAATETGSRAIIERDNQLIDTPTNTKAISDTHDTIAKAVRDGVQLGVKEALGLIGVDSNPPKRRNHIQTAPKDKYLPFDEAAKALAAPISRRSQSALQMLSVSHQRQPFKRHAPVVPKNRESPFHKETLAVDVLSSEKNINKLANNDYSTSFDDSVSLDEIGNIYFNKTSDSRDEEQESTDSSISLSQDSKNFKVANRLHSAPFYQKFPEHHEIRPSRFTEGMDGEQWYETEDNRLLTEIQNDKPTTNKKTSIVSVRSKDPQRKYSRGSSQKPAALPFQPLFSNVLHHSATSEVMRSAFAAFTPDSAEENAEDISVRSGESLVDSSIDMSVLDENLISKSLVSSQHSKSISSSSTYISGNSLFDNSNYDSRGRDESIDAHSDVEVEANRMMMDLLNREKAVRSGNKDRLKELLFTFDSDSDSEARCKNNSDDLHDSGTIDVSYDRIIGMSDSDDSSVERFVKPPTQLLKLKK